MTIREISEEIKRTISGGVPAALGAEQQHKAKIEILQCVRTILEKPQSNANNNLGASARDLGIKQAIEFLNTIEEVKRKY